MEARKDSDRPSLADFWMPPERDGGIGAPVTCLASTYTFHASLFENELMPRFLGLKYDRSERETLFVLEREDKLSTVSAAVFVDSTQVDPRQSTGRWLQVPVVVARGCQHAKVSILAWERFVRIIVSSANLTTTGYRRNREMAAVLDFFDGEEASPRELLADVLDFFDELVAFSRMPPGTERGLTQSISSIRSRVRAWQALPQRTDRLPSVTFAPVLPGRPRRRQRGALDALVASWGDRRATQISVMTPFTGTRPEGVRKTLLALLEIRRVRAAVGRLAIGGRPSANDATRFIVDLPGWFRDEWSKAWNTEASDLAVFVVPPNREGEPSAERALHAKAILVEGEGRTVLLMGSSNFSPHGLGLGVFNIEANLCFTARDTADAERLVDAMPVDWTADIASDSIWPEDPPPFEEELLCSGPPLPAVFLWATFHDRTGKLIIGLDRSQPFPSRWSIRLPGVDDALLQSDAIAGQATTGQIELILGSGLQTRRIMSVVVEWYDDHGRHDARLPTLVADEDELLAPEELRALSCDGILDCLLSGRDPIEWAELQSARSKGVSKDAYDPLKAVDTSAYTLYRTRRLGRALAALSRRLLSTLRTTTAMRHRLHRDPIGPVMLARTLAREAIPADDAERAATVFALTELMLCTAHVGYRIDRGGKLGLLPLFRETLTAMDALRRGCDADLAAAATGPLEVYVQAVRDKCDALVGSEMQAPVASDVEEAANAG